MTFNWTYKRALAAAVFIMLVMLTKNVIDQYDDLLSANLPNPDSYYKLVLIKDYDPAHGFQYIARDNAPEGSWIHWSIPHTWTVMQLHKGVMLFGVESEKALLMAGGGLTIFCMLLLAIFVAVTVLNIGSNLAAVLSVLALATSFPLFGYGQLLQITHHIYTLVPIAAACMFFFLKDMQTRKSFDFLGGLLLGLAIWISPETMPLVLAIAAARAALQLQQSSPTFLWPAAVGLMLMLTVGWLIDPPPPTFQSWALDHISLAWLLFGALVSALMLIADICVYRGVSFLRSLLVLSGSLIVCFGVWLLTVPGALSGPSGLVPLELKELWWSQINELQSISKPSQYVAYLTLPLLAGCWLLYISWREQKLWLAVVSLTVITYGVLGAVYIRMGAASSLISAIAFGVCISRLRVFSIDRDSIALPMQDQLFGAFIVLLLPLHVFVVTGLASLETAKQSKNNCLLNDVVDGFVDLPQGVVMLPVNYGPEMLYKTYHSIVAGNYHHNASGILVVINFFRASHADEVVDTINRRKVGYIAFCDGEFVSSDSFLLVDVDEGLPDWLAKLDGSKIWTTYIVKAESVSLR
ncbi:MAG: hypothetical protein U0998_10505 [Moraxellaceae bacterium]|nr:hypothetical protein [Moraxellaceae bacterium]MDZ4387605.1 hypothetical protein [Moraxellaceae bacterium]